MKERMYYFNRPEDMIALAQLIQSNLYWNKRFWDIESGDWMYYKDLWDYIETAFNNDYKGIKISEEDDVSFFS